MKIGFNQSNQAQNVKFTSLYGNLPKELSHLEPGFMKYAEDFMKDKSGYDVFLSTAKKNTNIKMAGDAGFLQKATTKKAISEIKSLQDLKEMLKDNYLTVQAGQDVLEAIGKVGRYFVQI